MRRDVSSKTVHLIIIIITLVMFEMRYFLSMWNIINKEKYTKLRRMDGAGN